MDMFLSIITVSLIVSCVSEEAQSVTSRDAPDSFPSLLSHPRITDIWGVHLNGKEGAGIKSFELQKVFIATTPGLLTSLIINKQSSSYDPEKPSSSCPFNDPSQINRYDHVDSYLKTLSLKEKLPAKTKLAFKLFYSQSETYFCKNQHLSLFGLSQLIGLGKYLLDSYFGKLKSLSSTHMHPGLAETFGDETLFHSLHALLFGLLTEKQFIHTHIDKTSSDFSQMPQKTMSSHDDVHYFVENSFHKENHLFKDSKVFTIKESNSANTLFGKHLSTKEIIDYLSSSLCPTSVGIPTKPVNMTFEDVSDIFDTSDLYTTHLTSSSVFRSYAIARTFSLRKLVKNWFFLPESLNQQSTDVTKDLKIITIDNLFMLSFLTALNIPVSQHMPSSRLVFESFMPLIARPVFRILDFHSEHIKFNKNNSLYFQHQPNNRISENNFHNKDNTLTDENLTRTLHFLTDETNASLEGIQNNIPLTSPVSELPKEYSEHENKERNFNTDNISQPYVRVVYNGQVVTSNIPGCEHDPMVNLGLCSANIVSTILDLVDLKQLLGKEEL